MSVPTNVAEILKQHVTLELESIDRMYCNLYIPQLQYEGGVLRFFHQQRGQPFASSALMAPISTAFVAALGRFAAERHVPLLTFPHGARKDDIALEHRARFAGEEGVLFIGKAQEKTRVFRTERRYNPVTGAPYPWIVPGSAMVNQYYVYALDRDFGPFFIKFSSYFPYTGRLCFNGHEYLKRQAAQRGIAFTALDNGIASTDDAKTLRSIADGLGAEQIERFYRKWLDLLPQPLSAADRDAGYRYDCSILQAEFSLTQVLDSPLAGRLLFEQLIRENLDLGRPDQVGLIFDRHIVRRGQHPTPGPFRTRVITAGVSPSLHVDYKHSRIKQYHKEGRALRTETTINDAGDFSIGKRLHNLAALRQVGFQANRRLLNVQRISFDCTIGEDAFQSLTSPVTRGRQRASGLPVGSARTQALLGALLVFRLLPAGFSAADLRAHLAPLLGLVPEALGTGRISYELRRLRLHGLIERIPRSHRYRVTEAGLPQALFLTRVHSRLLRPALARLAPPVGPVGSRLRRTLDAFEAAIDRELEEAALAA
jgi:hypothetical protein